MKELIQALIKDKYIVRNCLLLVFAYVQTYTHHVIRAISPTFAEAKIDLFLCQYPIDYVPVEWYFKMLCDDLRWVITLFVFARFMFAVSEAVYFVINVFFFEKLIDVSLFVYNYKTTVSIYWVLLAAVVSSVFFTIFKRKVYIYRRI